MQAHTRNRFLLAAMLTLALFASFARPSYAFLDKARFATHLGIAYFCFHHWVLGPYQNHAFDNGAPHRTGTIIKGGAALLFAVHEVKVAQKIAHKSNSPLLHKLDGKLLALTASFAAAGVALKSGHFDPAAIVGLKSSTDSVGDGAAKAGTPIKDVPIPDIGKPGADAADASDASDSSDSNSK